MYRDTFIYIIRKKKRKIWKTDENAMNYFTKRRKKDNKDLGKDFCLFVCFLRDSSQAQKLCSFLAAGFEPEPFLGSDSTILYSFDSLKSQPQLGEGRHASAAPARDRQESEAPAHTPPSVERGPLFLEPTQLSFPDRVTRSSSLARSFLMCESRVKGNEPDYI